jgi:beta-lactam-binding protein with PASTA domain
VPDVIGSADGPARSAITSAGLTVGSVTRAANCDFPNATVWDQSPGPGASVAPGSKVDLTEATGWQANGRLCPPVDG